MLHLNFPEILLIIIEIYLSKCSDICGILKMIQRTSSIVKKYIQPLSIQPKISELQKVGHTIIVTLNFSTGSN